MKSAAVIVDVQRDFCPPDGSLTVAAADELPSIINAVRERADFDLVVLTQDFHPPKHVSFASTHGKEVLSSITVAGGGTQVLWPEHCVQNSPGADFHPRLEMCGSEVIVQKGTNIAVDSYSAFFDNDQKSETPLNSILHSHGISRVYVCGVATDYCVCFTCRDALQLRYETVLLTDAVRGVHVDADVKTIATLQGVDSAKFRTAKSTDISTADIHTAW